tara:strand:+ start:62 stop:511 length:450 start_codon:yes stop_codon:yes gene_type:complete
MYNHNYDKCLVSISSKTFELCPYGINCKKKCNKIHNLEIFKLITQNLANTQELIKNQENEIDSLQITNNIQSYQIECFQKHFNVSSSPNETLHLLNAKNTLTEKDQEIAYLKSIKNTYESQINKLVQKNTELQNTNDTLQLLYDCNKLI